VTIADPAAPTASLRVARLMAVSLGIAGLILLGLDVDVIGRQWDELGTWWSVLALVTVTASSAAVGVVGAFGPPRAATASFVVLAGTMLVLAVLILVAATPDTLGRYPWLADLAVIGAAAAGAGLPSGLAVGYLVALLGVFGLEAVVSVVDTGRLGAVMHLVSLIFYTALFMALAIASRRAGDQLDRAIRSAVTEVSAAAAAEARRGERRRVEALIHDSVIVALLAFGRAGPGDRRPVREAERALAAIEDLEAAAPAEDPTPRELAWRLQALTTELDAEIRFDYRAAEEGRVPVAVGAAAAEAMSEAIRNSLRHAGSRELVARQVSVEAADGELRVVVLDDGRGFDPGAIAPTRLGIRESIVHRMSVAGGGARVLSQPGRGTTVLIEWRAS
jgi:signal transduction histidine kinase